MSTTHEELAELTTLGERLGALRLRRPDAERVLQQSLRRHGQLMAAVATPGADGGLELLDGFKRLAACRALGWRELRVRVVQLEGAQAKAALAALNEAGGMTELEHGWLVRSLYRDDGLTQPQIGQLLGRHKSWVCRRLMLVEQLDEAVQTDVRLGLLAARTAVAVARLPRGNQQRAAEVVARRGLTTKQTEQLVAALLAASDGAERQRIVDTWSAGQAGPGGADRRTQPSSTPGVQIVTDIRQMIRVAGRLEGRLLERPLSSLGAEAESTVRLGLAELEPVLRLLQGAVEQSLSGKEEIR